MIHVCSTGHSSVLTCSTCSIDGAAEAAAVFSEGMPLPNQASGHSEPAESGRTDEAAEHSGQYSGAAAEAARGQQPQSLAACAASFLVDGRRAATPQPEQGHPVAPCKQNTEDATESSSAEECLQGEPECSPSPEEPGAAVAAATALLACSAAPSISEAQHVRSSEGVSTTNVMTPVAEAKQEKAASDIAHSLDALLGTAPQIDFRKLRSEISSLPQVMSAGMHSK